MDLRSNGSTGFEVGFQGGDPGACNTFGGSGGNGWFAIAKLPRMGHRQALGSFCIQRRGSISLPVVQHFDPVTRLAACAVELESLPEPRV